MQGSFQFIRGVGHFRDFFHSAGFQKQNDFLSPVPVAAARRAEVLQAVKDENGDRIAHNRRVNGVDNRKRLKKTAVVLFQVRKERFDELADMMTFNIVVKRKIIEFFRFSVIGDQEPERVSGEGEAPAEAENFRRRIFFNGQRAPSDFQG